jgi:tetratricopeptide (TPR) repeat protein
VIRRGPVFVLRVVATVALFGLTVAGPARGASAAQEGEGERLREVARLEAAGAWQPADSVLRLVLAANPASLGALLTFERIASLRGHIEDVLPVAEALLEVEPTAIVAHQIRIRALSRLDRESGLEQAADEWMVAMPSVETAYREVARVWRSRRDYERAIRALERGRSHVDRADALALELGDVWADIGNSRAVVGEWSRAIGPNGEAFLLVQRRLAGLPDAGASVIPGLVDALVSADATVARRKAAVQLAIEAGLDGEAETIARSLVDELEGPGRWAFLVELGRRSDGAGLRRLALWAYGRIVAEGAETDPLLPVRTRMAELALSLGDTASAAAVYREVEDQLEPGSPERRQAISLRVQMLAGEGAYVEAEKELERLAAEPGSRVEVDLAAAILANALIDAGLPTAAERALASMEGPHVSLARGRILMTNGAVDRARAEILAAAPGLEGPEATEAIRLATLLGRLSDVGGGLVARGLAEISAGDRRTGVLLLYDGSEALPDAERAAILDFAASLADRIGLDAEAEQVRRDIVTQTPDSPEAPVALLTLARGHIDRRSPAEARLLLERLVFEYPRSALAPQARRELERLASQNRHP